MFSAQSLRGQRKTNYYYHKHKMAEFVAWKSQILRTYLSQHLLLRGSWGHRLLCGLWKVTVFHNGWVSTQRMKPLSSFPCLSLIREQHFRQNCPYRRAHGRETLSPIWSHFVWLHTILNTVRIHGFCKKHMHEHEQARTEADTSCMVFTHFLLR